MGVEPTKAEWDDENYEWPVTASPDPAVVDKLGKLAVAIGGRQVKEAHADRDVVMSFPNAAVPGVRVKKKVPRCECRRRAQIIVPLLPDSTPEANRPPSPKTDPLKICIVDDAVHLWPIHGNPIT